MIDDRNPNFARGFRASSAQLGELRSKWRDAGREAWETATRLGQDIKARTESELEALGREHLRRAELQGAQAREAGRVAREAVLAGRAVVRASPALIKEGVRQAATATRALPDAIRSGAKGVAGGFKIVAKTAAAPGTSSDPSPAWLAAEWATGLGPQARVLGRDSALSREFVEAPSVQDYLRRHASDWSREEGGVAGEYVVPHARRAEFGVGEFARDLEAGNAASHLVGSWDATARARGDLIDWTVENDSDLTSFGAGRILREAGLPFLKSYSRPWPGGRTHQTIQLSTDLEGRPLP